MLILLNKIPHLLPPDYITPLSIAKFSEYFNKAKQEKITNIRPLKIYSLLYPKFSKSDLFNIAYNFKADFANARSQYENKLTDKVDEWKNRYSKGAKLSYFHKNKHYWICDHRYNKRSKPYRLNNVEWALLQATDSVRVVSNVIDEILEQRNITKKEVLAALELFRKKNWVVEEEQKILSIIVQDGFFVGPAQKSTLRTLSERK